jgi:hypothetical protein
VDNGRKFLRSIKPLYEKVHNRFGRKTGQNFAFRHPSYTANKKLRSGKSRQTITVGALSKVSLF